jgi:hypothetical protein
VRSDAVTTARARLGAVPSWLAQRKQPRSPAVRRALFVVAVSIFAGSTVWAVRTLDGVPLADGWPALLALTAALALGAFAVNAVEFAVSARLLSARASAADAFKVSILGSAANVLPIPGAALVRAGALRRMGLELRSAVAVTATVGLAWVATGALIAGTLLLGSTQAVVGAACLAGGIAAYAVAFGLLVVQIGLPAARSGILLVAGVELASVGLNVVRTWVVLRTLGVDAELVEAAAIGVAGIVASAAGLFPGGLGLREALSAAIAAVVGLPAAMGVLVATVDRVVGYVTLAAATGVLLALGVRPRQEAAAATADTDLPDEVPAVVPGPDPDPDPDTDKVPR